MKARKKLYSIIIIVLCIGFSFPNLLVSANTFDATNAKKCNDEFEQLLDNSENDQIFEVYIEYSFSVTPKEDLEQRAREICHYPENDLDVTNEQIHEYKATYRRLLHEDRVNNATEVMEKLGIYESIVMLRWNPVTKEDEMVETIDSLFYGIPSTPCRFMLSAEKIRELLTAEEVHFIDLYVLENLQWYKDFYQDIDGPEPDESEWKYRDAFYAFVQAKEEDQYYYKELYYHYQDDAIDWALVKAQDGLQVPMSVETSIQIGGIAIEGDLLRTPFITAYGVYNVSENMFYGLEQLTETYTDYKDLIKILNQFHIGTIIHVGDANMDGTVSISDVTAIQRYIAEMHELSDIGFMNADANGDGKVDIADATHWQMHLAEYDVKPGAKT